MKILVQFVALVLLWGTLCASASADVFYLANGGQINGRLLNANEKPRESYDVRTDDGARLRLTTSQVRKFVPTSDARRNYETLLPRMPLTAEGNWTMAQWCLSEGLDEEREHHLHEVVRLDPDHRDARLALGYTSIDGKWVKTDEWNRARGYVYHQGSWRTPQEVVMLKQQERYEELTRSYKPLLKRLRAKLGSRNARSAETALAEIRAIKDPLAGEALAEVYADEENPLVRKLWVEVLGANSSVAATDALVKAAIEDEDGSVRDKARDHLADRNDGRAVGALLAELKSKDNVKVNRAGAALALIKDPGSLLPLIEALVTEHQYVVTTGRQGNLGATFSPTGGSGLSAGGGSKVVKQNVNNRDVLSALSATVLEHFDQPASYGFDETRWKEWYAAKTTPEDLNLRRDP